MLHAEARRRARRNAEGEFVPLAEQDVALWDVRMIDEAEALLTRASALGAIGRYQLEAALQSAHVHRCRTGESNWAEIVQLYDALFALSRSRPWLRSIARWRSRKCRVQRPRLRPCPRPPTIRGLRNTSPTGPRVPSC